MANIDAKPANAPTFSLVVSSLNRELELDKFLEHLDRQTYKHFELFLVDQNPEGGAKALLARHSVSSHYIPSNLRGVACGRNGGLRIAQGDILAIPDDDCWYPPELLEKVARWFTDHPDIDILCVVECNPQGEAMVPQKPPSAGLCSDQPIGLFMERSVWLAQSSMVFLRRRVRDAIGVMNEQIGVGSPSRYQSGEETDYFLRALHAGYKMWFEPSIRIFHVELRTPERLRKAIFPYALGTGYVLREHGCKLPRLLAVVCRSLGAAFVSACRLRFREVPLYLSRGIAIFMGYFGRRVD